MLSACTKEFLSHPIEEKKHSLIDHLLEVGNKSKEIFSQTSFTNTSLAFYSGLLHDIGKINPFYQEIFHETKDRKRIKDEISEKYLREHSRFSAWAADKLLQKSGLDHDTLDKIMVLIYGHHSTIRRNLGITKGDKITATQDAISEALHEFASQVSNTLELSELNWDSCIEKFPRPINFDVELSESKNSPDDYLEMSYAFSCLLQADRGSFEPWSVPNFDLRIDTSSLTKHELTEKLSDSAKINRGKINSMRTRFQKQVMENFDYSETITVINAPTGIGKTKVFLDLIAKYRDDENIHRVFYFSPLLALTEDFEKKFECALEDKKTDDVLIYNHIFSDSLEEKRRHNNEGYVSKWNFLTESFNKKFIITTTQRLLTTLYSNTEKDKMKLASFRNSVLIIDEVQTIPKFILSNLKDMFLKMGQYMGTRIILVSATIPKEISDIKKVQISKDLLSDYLVKTQKQISVVKSLDIPTLKINKTLVMANTRKKAVNIYNEIKQTHKDNENIYLSSGIKKKNRKDILESLSKKVDYVLTSTQVVEAGVDISFSNIYREMAPLDNLIQVMGRLNREGLESDARLIVFTMDGSEVPYSKLEFDKSWDFIQKIHSSEELYDILEQYYREISADNHLNRNNAQELKNYIQRLDFGKVWECVKKNVFEEDGRDSVFIPEAKDWNELKDALANNRLKDNFKQYGLLTATLPRSVYKIGIEYFDEELMEKNILLPKKEHLKTIYDEDMGLDKWVVTK